MVKIMIRRLGEETSSTYCQTLNVCEFDIIFIDVIF